ncbi:hypothetical protein D3C79_785590 [compost metagenome]
MAIGIKRHAGIAKLHPGRLLDDGQAVSLPFGQARIDTGFVGQREGQLHGPCTLGSCGFDGGVGPERQFCSRFEREHGKGGGLLYRRAAE